jgi:thymidylate synthase
MHVIKAQNINDAWWSALRLIHQESGSPGAPPYVQSRMVRSPSRVGDVYVYDTPVTTVYERPTERVLLDVVRDNNPLFSLFEGLWMLAGRDDAAWLDVFIHDFSARFAEPDGTMHGAYGKRWRGHFYRTSDADEGVDYHYLDQLDECVRLLRANPGDRQAVIQMWDPAVDLGVPGLRDRPCNVAIMLRVRAGVLDMTVTCRSNDVVWGAYGANVVHMSMLQEYLAARIGVGVGRYYQISNNWHYYVTAEKLMSLDAAADAALAPYPGTRALVDDPDSFDEELREFMLDPHHFGAYRTRPVRNGFLRDTAWPLWVANEERNKRDDPYRYDHALAAARDVAAPDWRTAAVAWLERRRDKLKGGEGQGHA